MIEDIMAERNKHLDALADYLDQHEVTISDMLAVVCANILNNGGGDKETELLVAGHRFKISFKEVK